MYFKFKKHNYIHLKRSRTFSSRGNVINKREINFAHMHLLAVEICNFTHRVKINDLYLISPS